MAETTRKRFDISEKSSTKRRVDKTDFRMDCAKRALNVVRIDKQNTGLIHVTNLFPYFLIPLFPLSERRLTHQFGTEWQNYINLILLKDNDKWRRNNITFVTNLFPCLGFAPRSQSLACCAYAQAGSFRSLSGLASLHPSANPLVP